MKKEKGLVDMTSGPILSKMVSFFLPIMFTSWLNMAFNAADKVVVGRFAGSAALAAVGASSPITMFVFSLSTGLCSGVSVEAAKNYGAGKLDDLKKTVQTSVTSSVLIGILLAFVTFMLAKPVLNLLGTPADIFGDADDYLKIYFLSIPGILCYNFGSAILRSLGDTKRPLYILLGAGVINVALNVIFVAAFHMDVVGVALATAISQYFSAAAVLVIMIKDKGLLHFDIRKPQIEWHVLGRVLKVGVPAGVQGVIFSISDMALQSAVNSLGSAAVSGASAAMTVDGFIFGSMGAVTQACMVFTGQNVGAKKYKRAHKVLRLSIVLAVGVGIIMGWACFFLRNQVIGLIISDSAEAVKYGIDRVNIIATTTFIYGALDVITAALRGYGVSTAPAVVSIVGICGFRILWSKTYFLSHRSLFHLYLSYPLAWLISMIPEIIIYLVVVKKIEGRDKAAEEITE